MASQMTSQKPVGPALRNLMAEQNVRAEEVAYKLGVSYTTVMRWMAGRNEPTPGMGDRLGELFGVPSETFYAKAAA